MLRISLPSCHVSGHLLYIEFAHQCCATNQNGIVAPMLQFHKDSFRLVT